eukprot:scaffold4195_cov28-Tisochrysis_lutea.AAC.1
MLGSPHTQLADAAKDAVVLLIHRACVQPAADEFDFLDGALLDVLKLEVDLIDTPLEARDGPELAHLGRLVEAAARSAVSPTSAPAAPQASTRPRSLGTFVARARHLLLLWPARHVVLSLRLGDSPRLLEARVVGLDDEVPLAAGGCLGHVVLDREGHASVPSIAVLKRHRLPDVGVGWANEVIETFVKL